MDELDALNNTIENLINQWLGNASKTDLNEF